MTGFAQLERAALCSTLTRVGPDAPTLCDDWTTRDLAAHLVMRERRPDAAAGVLLPALAEHTARVQGQYADQSWAGLVDMVRQGPKGWTPMRVPGVDDAINLMEFYVHHEDVLRAQPGWSPEQRRRDPELDEALWVRLRQAGQLLFRRSPVGVVLRVPRAEADGAEHDAWDEKQVKAPTRQGSVVVSGEPGEIALLAFGRTAVGQVDVAGEAACVEAFRETAFGV